MPNAISNTIPIINTSFSIIIFIIAIINAVIKKDETKLKGFNKNITILILIGFTASIQLYFTYFGKEKVNKSSATLLIFNILLCMWLISLINDKKCTPVNCKLYEETKEDNKKPFFKDSHIMTSIISGIFVLISFILIYFNNKEKVDDTLGKAYGHTTNLAGKAYGHTTNFAGKAYNSSKQIASKLYDSSSEMIGKTGNVIRGYTKTIN